MTEHEPEVAEFILCEDIREETYGKVSLMGLYREKFAFVNAEGAVWPRALRHAVYIRIHHLPQENLRLVLRVEEGEKILFEHKGNFEQSSDSPKTELNVNANLTVLVSGYGELITRIRVENEDGKLLIEKTRQLSIVERVEPANGTATGQGT